MHVLDLSAAWEGEVAGRCMLSTSDWGAGGMLYSSPACLVLAVSHRGCWAPQWLSAPACLFLIWYFLKILENIPFEIL